MSVPSTHDFGASLHDEWFRYFPVAYSGFKKNCLEHYGIISDKIFFDNDEEVDFDHNKLLWCPILQHHLNLRYVNAVHICPVNIGKEAFQYLFSIDDLEATFLAPKNGIFLQERIRYQFQKYNVVIVPNSKLEVEVKVLNHQILEQKLFDSDGETGVTFADIHGRTLKWKNDERPEKGFLYFHWLLAILAMNARGLEKSLVLEELARWKENISRFSEGMKYWVRQEFLLLLREKSGLDIPLDHSFSNKDPPVSIAEVEVTASRMCKGTFKDNPDEQYWRGEGTRFLDEEHYCYNLEGEQVPEASKHEDMWKVCWYDDEGIAYNAKGDCVQQRGLGKDRFTYDEAYGYFYY